MADSFEPQSEPSVQGTTRTVRRRVNSAQFGDGYSQRSGDGMNASVRALTVQWSNIEAAESDVYEAFFHAHRSTPFVWQSPLETVSRKWIAGDSTQTPVSGSLVNYSCPLTEVFDL